MVYFFSELYFFFSATGFSVDFGVLTKLDIFREKRFSRRHLAVVPISYKSIHLSRKLAITLSHFGAKLPGFSPIQNISERRQW